MSLVQQLLSFRQGKQVAELLKKSISRPPLPCIDKVQQEKGSEAKGEGQHARHLAVAKAYQLRAIPHHTCQGQSRQGAEGPEEETEAARRDDEWSKGDEEGVGDAGAAQAQPCLEHREALYMQTSTPRKTHDEDADEVKQNDGPVNREEGRV